MKKNLIFFDLDKTLIKIDSSYFFIMSYYKNPFFFYAILRKIRLISKFTFYKKLTNFCEKKLVDKSLDIFVEAIYEHKNDELLELAKNYSRESNIVVVVSSSPHIYVSKVAEKFEAFAHDEYNKTEFKSHDHIRKCMETGEDLFKRKVKKQKISKDFFPQDLLDLMNLNSKYYFS